MPQLFSHVYHVTICTTHLINELLLPASLLVKGLEEDKADRRWKQCWSLVLYATSKYMFLNQTNYAHNHTLQTVNVHTMFLIDLEISALTYQARSSTQQAYFHSLFTHARKPTHFRTSNSGLIFALRVKTNIGS